MKEGILKPFLAIMFTRAWTLPFFFFKNRKVKFGVVNKYIQENFQGDSYSFRFYLSCYLFIWLCWVLVVAHGIFPCGAQAGLLRYMDLVALWHVGSNFLTRN